jgi:hypothetical protein
MRKTITTRHDRKTCPCGDCREYRDARHPLVIAAVIAGRKAVRALDDLAETHEHDRDCLNGDICTIADEAPNMSAVINSYIVSNFEGCLSVRVGEDAGQQGDTGDPATGGLVGATLALADLYGVLRRLDKADDQPYWAADAGKLAFLTELFITQFRSYGLHSPRLERRLAEINDEPLSPERKAQLTVMEAMESNQQVEPGVVDLALRPLKKYRPQ